MTEISRNIPARLFHAIRTDDWELFYRESVSISIESTQIIADICKLLGQFGCVKIMQGDPWNIMQGGAWNNAFYVAHFYETHKYDIWAHAVYYQQVHLVNWFIQNVSSIYIKRRGRYWLDPIRCRDVATLNKMRQSPFVWISHAAFVDCIREIVFLGFTDILDWFIDHKFFRKPSRWKILLNKIMENYQWFILFHCWKHVESFILEERSLCRHIVRAAIFYGDWHMLSRHHPFYRITGLQVKYMKRCLQKPNGIRARKSMSQIMADTDLHEFLHLAPLDLWYEKERVEFQDQIDESFSTLVLIVGTDLVHLVQSYIFSTQV